MVASTEFPMFYLHRPLFPLWFSRFLLLFVLIVVCLTVVVVYVLVYRSGCTFDDVVQLAYPEDGSDGAVMLCGRDHAIDNKTIYYI